MKKIVLINEAAVNPKVSLCQQHCMKNSRSCALKMTGSTWMQCQISLVEEVSIIPIDGKCRQRSFLWVVETLWRRFLLSVCFLLVGCVARNRSSSSVSNWYFCEKTHARQEFTSSFIYDFHFASHVLLRGGKCIVLLQSQDTWKVGLLVECCVKSCENCVDQYPYSYGRHRRN
jgi:hypothetical protein